MSEMIPVADVSDPRFQIALGRECPVCGAGRGELCGEDEGVHPERVSDNDDTRISAKLAETEGEVGRIQ